MSDTGPESLILHLLRRIDTRVDGLVSDMIEGKERLGLMEGSVASISRRLDRVAGDVDQIKRRLELTDAPT